MKPRCFFRVRVVSLTAMALMASPLSAQSTWKGGTSVNWSVATNWLPAAVPASGSAVIFSDTTTNGLTLDGTTSRVVSSLTLGDSGTRATTFTLNTQAGNNLTIQGGVVANGSFASGTAALTMRGHYVVAADQVWSVGGSAAHNTDQGVFVREVTTGGTNRGSLTLNGNLTKSGAGQLLFAAIDVTGAGNLVINSGDLKLNAGASQPLVVGGSGNITLNNAAVLAVYKNSGTMNLTRPVVMNGTSSLVAVNTPVDIASPIAFRGTHSLSAAGATQLSGAWTGSGVVNRSGAGAVTLSGDLTGFTGTLAVAAGVTHVPSAFGGSLGVSGGTVNLSAPVAGTLGLSGTGVLNGEVAVAGKLTMGGGTLSVDPGTAGSLSTAGDLDLAASTTVTLASNPQSTAPFAVLRYGGVLSGNLANLSLLGGTTNYRTPVFDGSTPGVITLAVGSAARTWNGGTVWDINNTANWLEGDQKFYQLDSVTFGDTGAGTLAISGVVSPSSVVVDSQYDYGFTADAISWIAGAGGLSKRGAGVLTLGGVNTFTGGVRVEGGVLKAGGSQALGANGKTITVNSGATLDTNGLMGVSRDYHAVISGAGVEGMGGAIVNSTLTDHQSGFRSLTLEGDAVIGGNARWDVRPITAGQGMVNLNSHVLTKKGINKIAMVECAMAVGGKIVVEEGTLALTRGQVAAGVGVEVKYGATLQFENNTVGLYSYVMPVVVDGGRVLVSGAVTQLDAGLTLVSDSIVQCDSDFAVGGQLGGAGSLSKTGAGVLVFGGDAVYAGTTTVHAGTLQIGTGGTTGSFVGNVTNYGTVTFNRSDSFSYDAVISGNGGMVKAGGGMLTLSKAQEFSGPTVVNGGVLVLSGGANRLPATTALTTANVEGAGVDMNDCNQEVRSLAGGGLFGGGIGNSGGNVVVLTVRPMGTDGAAFAGPIQDGIRLEVLGDKTEPAFVAPRQRLAGVTNSYTGGTLVDGATLMARQDGSLGAVPAEFDPDNVVLRNHGTLLNETDGNLLTLHANRGVTLGQAGGALVAGFNTVVTVEGVISGVAGNPLSIVGNNGTVVLTGENTYEGDTVLLPPSASGPARLQIGNGGSSGRLGLGKVVNQGQLAFNRADAISVANSISGTGTLIQQGTGVLTLTGLNSYTGNTTVNAGTLVLAKDATLALTVGDATNTRIAGAGALTLDGTLNIDTSAVTVASGTWSLVDVGTLTEAYGVNFAVAGWTRNAGVWSKREGGRNWAFSEATGILELSAGGADFASWMAGFDFSAMPGADLGPAGDADGDGLANAVEMVLGTRPDERKVDRLPVGTRVSNPPGVPAGDYLKFVYRRTRASVESGVESAAQYAPALSGEWVTAVHGVDGVVVLEGPDEAIPGDWVEVYIPVARGVSGGLFARLRALVP